jgi:flagellar basal-body rod modification protein FlgD
MSISAVTPQSSGVDSGNALSQLSKDYDKFIGLLVAQVQNQDPLEPMDSTEFVTQTAQLTQVEQAVQTNSQLDLLRSDLAIMGALYETALIGKSVTVPSGNVNLTDTGGAFSYQLETDSVDIVAFITDNEGTVVRRLENLQGAGGEIHDVSWDGLNDTGQPLPYGVYQVNLESSNEEAGYNTFMTAKVASIEYLNGVKKLRLDDGTLIPSDNVIRAS